MDVLDRIDIECGSIIATAADLLILKYADDFHGADAVVANAIGFREAIPDTEHRFVPAPNTMASEALFLGVGPLFDFRYHAIEAFSVDVLQLVVRERPQTRIAATTIHGPGYGLDEREAFESQLAGYLRWGDHFPLDRLIIVENDSRRAERLRRDLAELKSDPKRIEALIHGISYDPFTPPPPIQVRPSHVPPIPEQFDHEIALILQNRALNDESPLLKTPAPSTVWSADDFSDTLTRSMRPEKPKLFVAMPFSEDHLDEYEIAFADAAHNNGFMAERLDMESYVGDVVLEIKRRIGLAAGVISLLNDANPNVMFETGYAIALEKPIILVAKDNQEIPFDLRGYNRLSYSRVAPLRTELTKLIGDLKQDGTLGLAADMLRV